MTASLRHFAIFLLLWISGDLQVSADERWQRPALAAGIQRLPPVGQTRASLPPAAPRPWAGDAVAGAIQVEQVIRDPQVRPASWEPPAWDVDPEAEELPAPEALSAGPMLQLRDVVDSIFATLPQLQVVSADRQIEGGRAVSAWGKFDTKLEASAIEQPLGFYENFRHAIGAKQPTWSGADLFAGYRIGRGLFEPWYENRDTNNGGEFKAGFSVPLLRDRAIDKRRADVLKSQLARRAVEPEIQAQLLTFIREGSKAYWDWVAAGQSRRVAESLLQLALERDGGLRKALELGNIAEIEVVDNQRLIVSRRAKLIEADRKLQQAAIKLSLWLRSPDGIPRVPVPQLLPPEFPEPQLPNRELMQAAADVALNVRPELARLSLVAQQAEVELANARNDLLPGLEFSVDASQDVGEASNSLRDKQPFKLTAALLADVPLQRRDARGRMQSAQGKLAQVNAKRRFTGDKITAEVRDAISALITARDRIRQARRSVELNLQMERAEQRRFELGNSDLLVLNLREQATANAAQTEVDALAEFFKAMADFRAAIASELAPLPPPPREEEFAP